MELQKKVFKVTTGRVDEAGRDSGNYSAYVVIETTAKDAINKAAKMMGEEEYAESVELICTIDVE